MNFSDDLERHELRNLTTQNMTRSRSQSTDSINESVKSTINETKQSVYIDEIIQDDIGNSCFCLSCCFKFDDNINFLKHLNQHHFNQIKLTFSQEKFLRQISYEYRFLSISIDSRIKTKFLRKYSHDLIVLNEETAIMLDELNKEENEDDYCSDSSEKELSVHDENNLYDTRPKLSLLFVDYSIIKPSRVFFYLKDLFVKSYTVFKSSSDARNDLSDPTKEPNENKNPKKTSSQVFHSRNACKKLKCPKCNWHYKYRETLDIHMREKHSTDFSQTMSQQCIYCVENIQHPRLGRGEQYKCGYKPYRCDICDYSTTTKGNLSIHMQSDKHINNLKEIASKPQEKNESTELESNDSIDANRKLLNKKYLNSRILVSNLPQDQSNSSFTTTSNKSKSNLPQTEIDNSLLCPLCHIGFNRQILLENHLKESHCVINEDTIQNLVQTAQKTEPKPTMKTSNSEELLNRNQENEFEMNVDNQADLDFLIDNLINNHNDTLDTLLSSYLYKNKLVYTNFVANLITDHLVTSSSFVPCYNCSPAKYSNLTELKQHLIDSHDLHACTLSQTLVQSCVKQFAACTSSDELKQFVASSLKANRLSDKSIDLAVASLILERMNKTFSLNKPAASKLPFSAESLLSSAQPKSDNQLLSYLKSAQMGSAQPNALFNQFFLPFMFSPAAPVSPDNNDDSFKSSDNLDESLDGQSAASRRRRTRITEDQLKILRQHFDINKSPTDEQVVDIARQTHLQAKVIKHWFRNTLFKERQKDKDSPYNFNNPPITQLNLEEYEKTGKIVAEPANHKETLFKQEQSNDTAASTINNQISNNNLNNNTDLEEDKNTIYNDNSEEHNLSSSRCSSVAGAKNRPNRTKFSDSQIKALNLAFKQHRYPKDEQISQLAGQLGLKARVITVWFQNARQKARKSSFNKDSAHATEDLADLDEYYDAGDDECDDETHSHVSSSSTDKSSGGGDNVLAMAAAAAAAAANTKALQLQLAMSLLAAHQHQQQQQQQQGDKTLSGSSSCASSSSQSKKNDDDDDDLDELDELDDDEDDDETDSTAKLTNHVNSTNPNQNLFNNLTSSHNNASGLAPSSTKRLRTTILPEQQEFLMQKYQLDQNPSRKMLDEIARQVRLKKRVVQVWFQNTRARERKGIIKINSPMVTASTQMTQVCQQTNLKTPTLKKCARTELESHLMPKLNCSYEQENEMDEAAKLSAQSQSNNTGLNSVLMSTLFAHLQQQQQQQQQQLPFDLSFKSAKTEPVAKVESRSRSNSGSGQASVARLKSFGQCAVKRDSLPGQRRVRTQMTQYQVNVMRLIFAEYKTPTMNECELMGKEINLKKRVVQVWFQNARAKEKKNSGSTAARSILFSNSVNNDLSNFEFSPDECLLCEVKYGACQSQREHLFSKQHLAKLVQFVSRIAVENGAGAVDFAAKGSAKHDESHSDLNSESDSDDELNTEDTDDDEPSRNLEPANHDADAKLSTAFDVNRLLQGPPRPPPQPAANSQFYNYILYSNLLNQQQQQQQQQQPKVMHSSSDSSSCSVNSTPSSANTSPPFYGQFQNPVLAQIYAAFAAQQHQQQQQQHASPLLTLDHLGMTKSVQADVERQMACVPGQTIQFTVDGSDKAELIDKCGLGPSDIEQQVLATHFVCATCKTVSASRETLATHQCLNQIVNMNLMQSNVFRLEQVGYKCVTCHAKDAHSECVFANAADFVHHVTKLEHFTLKKIISTNSVFKRNDQIDLDSNNNNFKKIKY